MASRGRIHASGVPILVRSCKGGPECLHLRRGYVALGSGDVTLGLQLVTLAYLLQRIL
ncbi:hypothetical protein [Mesorhizobium sp.]|uniref:hypothetical protein n=1 Tax=Mesorhizobium sp. TaxID=1871066 RepID=UPI00258000AD|nr:hypothetical protein [Mesorhizobium sp.]